MAFFAAGASQAGEVQVAVASSAVVVMSFVAKEFTARSGHAVKLSAAATGTLRSQIVAGAPFEILVAADDESPRQLVAEGFAVPGSDFTYALGRLALWSARTGLVDDRGRVLSVGTFDHLAVPNPKLAPYGAAAISVINAMGLSAQLGSKLVLGQNIAQVHQFVASGNAELGFVAWSQLVRPNGKIDGSYWLVPKSLSGELRQNAVLLRAGAHNPAAVALLAFLKTVPARELFRSYGYEE